MLQDRQDILHEIVVAEALYVRRKQLGRGSFGVVDLYERRAGSSDMPLGLAVKSMDNSSLNLSKTEIDISRALRLYKPQWTTNILAGYTSNAGAFIVMEYYSNGTLFDILDIRLPRPELYIYLAEMITAVHFLNQRGIIHRDIKPENILIGSDNHIRLGDFGLARHFTLPSRDILHSTPEWSAWTEVYLVHSTRVAHGLGPLDKFPLLWARSNPWTVENEIAGTVPYSPPEVHRGEKYSFGVDYYSIGVITHVILTGDYPFADVGKIDAEPGSNEHRVPKLSTDKLKIEEMLALSPEERLDYEEIIKHDMFRGLKWDTIASRQYPIIRGTWLNWTNRLRAEGRKFQD
ncbi:kinase-like domain-containing protein [Cyathus striatus]|nr:kinase-like domain-containing protein [Cyathus striatus]